MYSIAFKLWFFWCSQLCHAVNLEMVMVHWDRECYLPIELSGATCQLANSQNLGGGGLHNVAHLQTVAKSAGAKELLRHYT